MENDHLILSKPIEKLEVSDEFKAICGLNKFKNLSQVLNYNAGTLLDKYGFSMHAIMELVEIQEKNNLGRLVKD